VKPLADDTELDIERRLIAAWRGMSPDEKFHVLCELTLAAENWSRSGLREQHPDADEHELALRLAALKYGSDLVHEAHGWRA
jgi:hypothetical protein